MHDLIRIAKGMIGPGDLNPGGQLRPEAADRLISLISASGFMANVTTRRMKKLTADVSVIGVVARSLVRVAEGQSPTDAQRLGATQHGCTLTALPVQLFPQMSLSTLRDNADNPALVAEVEKLLSDRMEAELEDLAFNGTADDNSGGFTTLNKGWIQVAADAAATPKVNIDPGGTQTWRQALKAVYDACPDVYRPQSAFVMSEADADAYAFEVAGTVSGTAYIAESPLRRFMGRPILTSAYCPAGKVLFTPPQNLIFGMTTEIWQKRRWDDDARALRWVFDFAVDYEIAIKQACVYGY
ncbi:phage major capsid protein [Pseudothauera hydrothermalis]|uniref:phage major capsid protein n=1 Tax=Pseudothauera hydrothermalis TaxID=2184083 RepID=UPI000E096947|nr:phage major capsid protein [Pseudothauera hydrothermalis]